MTVIYILQVPNFAHGLCCQQMFNVKVLAKEKVLTWALALDEGKAEVHGERGLTHQSMWIHETSGWVPSFSLRAEVERSLVQRVLYDCLWYLFHHSPTVIGELGKKLTVLSAALLNIFKLSATRKKPQMCSAQHRIDAQHLVTLLAFVAISSAKNALVDTAPKSVINFLISHSFKIAECLF